MKRLLLILILFTSLVAYSQQKAPTNKELQQQIEQLDYKYKHQINALIQELAISKGKVELLDSRLEHEKSKTQDLISSTTMDHINSDLIAIGMVITFLAALIGIGGPLFFNSRIKEKADDLATLVDGKIENMKELAKNRLERIDNDVERIKEIEENTKKIEAKFEDLRKEAVSASSEAKAYALCADAAGAATSDNIYRAFELLSEAKKIGEYSFVYNSQGDIYKNLKNYSRAIESYNKAIAVNPKDATAFKNKGIMHYEKGEYNIAIENYDIAISVDSKYATAYNARGVAYYRLNNKDKAIENYTQASNLNPDYARAYNNRGMIYSEKGEYDKAIADYNKALEINPQYIDVYYNRARVYRQLAEQTTDPVKKAEYTLLAEADKKRYEELIKAQKTS